MTNIGLSLLETLVLVNVAIAVSIFLAAIGVIIRAITRPSSMRISAGWIGRFGVFAGFPFSIIGMVSGYLTGLSRVSAISALVPAALTLMGGIAVFLFGKGGKTAVLAAFAVVNFSLMILVGGLIGGRERVEIERTQNSVEYREQEIDKEFLVERYRRALGLDPKSSPQASEVPAQ